MRGRYLVYNSHSPPISCQVGINYLYITVFKEITQNISKSFMCTDCQVNTGND